MITISPQQNSVRLHQYCHCPLTRSCPTGAALRHFKLDRRSTSDNAGIGRGCYFLLTVAIYLLRKRPLSGFGLLFFLVNISPEYLLVPQYAFFGYRASLPMPGLLLIVADLVVMARQWAARQANAEQDAIRAQLSRAFTRELAVPST